MALPTLPQTKNRQVDGNYAFNNGAIVLTPKELVDLLDQHGGSAKKAAGALGVSEVSTVSKWGDQARKKLQASEEERLKREEANSKLLEGVLDKVQGQLDLAKKVRSESGWFFNTTNKKAFTSIGADIEKLVALQKGSPEVLEQMVDGIKSLGDKYDRMIAIDANKRRMDEETRLENQRKFGNDRGTMSNAIQMGNHNGGRFNMADAMDNTSTLLWGLLLDPKMIASAVAGMGLTKIIGSTLKSPLLLAATSAAFAIGDAFTAYAKAEDWDVNGISAAIGGFLGGDGEGGIMNAFSSAGKWASMGALVGMVGGVPGMIAGGLIGAAVGGIMGWIGAENIAKAVNDTATTLASWSDQVLGSNFIPTVEQIKERITAAQESTRMVTEHVNALVDKSITLQGQIDVARQTGNQDLVDSLQRQKDAIDASVLQAQVDLAINEQSLGDAQRDLTSKQTAWWRSFDHIMNFGRDLFASSDENMKILNAEFERLKGENSTWWSNNDAVGWTDKATLWTRMALSTGWDTITKNIGPAIVQGGADAIEGAKVWINSGFDTLMASVQTWWNDLMSNLNPFKGTSTPAAEPWTGTDPVTGQTVTQQGLWDSIDALGGIAPAVRNMVTEKGMSPSSSFNYVPQQKDPELDSQIGVGRLLKEVQLGQVRQTRVIEPLMQTKANPSVAPQLAPIIAPTNSQSFSSVNNNMIMTSGFSAVDRTFFGGR